MSLESAALGRPIGVADTDPVREYFGENAIYCNPYDVLTIAECLKQLYEETCQAPPIGIWGRFEWRQALMPLLDVFDYREDTLSDELTTEKSIR
ncbi:hypothetical protein D3C84_1024960 [compost metagenome]